MSSAIPPVPPMSEGAIAAFGTLELSMVSTPPPTFDVDGRSAIRCRVKAPGTLIGREAPADLRFYGASASFQEVSAAHVMLMLSPVGWVIRDADSSNGTYVRAPGGRRARLNPNQQVRVVDEMTVELPQHIAFKIFKHGSVGGGTVLTRGTQLGAVPGIWPDDPELAALLEVLIEPFRDGGSTPQFNPEYVMERLGCGRTTAGKRRKQLAELPRIRPEVPNPDRVTFEQLAHAAARAYPELVNLTGRGEGPGDPSAGDPTTDAPEQ